MEIKRHVVEDIFFEILLQYSIPYWFDWHRMRMPGSKQFSREHGPFPVIEITSWRSVRFNTFSIYSHPLAGTLIPSGKSNMTALSRGSERWDSWLNLPKHTIFISRCVWEGERYSYIIWKDNYCHIQHRAGVISEHVYVVKYKFARSGQWWITCYEF